MNARRKKTTDVEEMETEPSQDEKPVKGLSTNKDKPKPRMKYGITQKS